MSCQCVKITFVGDSFKGDSYTNPFTELELYEANKYADWECVETYDGTNYYVHTDIQIGDGVSPTYFISRGKNIIFDVGKGFITTDNSYIEVSAVWTSEEKEEIQNKLDSIQADLDNPDQYKADVSALALEATSQSIKAKTDTIDWTDIDFINNVDGGKWIRTGHQLIFYKADNVTEVARFNLYQADGTFAEEGDTVYERRRI